MKYLILLALLFITAHVPALAQTKIVIGGVDQRVPPAENEILAKQLMEMSQKFARAVALYSVEHADKEEAEKNAIANRAWLDQAWHEMEYWRAYSGH